MSKHWYVAAIKKFSYTSVTITYCLFVNGMNVT